MSSDATAAPADLPDVRTYDDFGPAELRVAENGSQSLCAIDCPQGSVAIATEADLDLGSKRALCRAVQQAVGDVLGGGAGGE
jgi:hypothetical protein